MKKIIYLLVFILLFNIVNANEIKEIAEELQDKHSDYITYRNIDIWIYNNIDYKFFWYPRGVRTTWQEKLGDCTDTAMLKREMFNHLGIKNKLVYGYADNEKHDWIEIYLTQDYYLLIYQDESWKIYNPFMANYFHYLLPGSKLYPPIYGWFTFEELYFEELIKVGEGIW